MIMNIILSPTRTDTIVNYEKKGKTLIIDGQIADFSRMQDGDTLPRQAIDSIWFDEDVTMNDGVLTLTIVLPLPENYSQEQAFPLPLIDVPDGVLNLPKPLLKSFEEGVSI